MKKCLDKTKYKEQTIGSIGAEHYLACENTGCENYSKNTGLCKTQGFIKESKLVAKSKKYSDLPKTSTTPHLHYLYFISSPDFLELRKGYGIK